MSVTVFYWPSATSGLPSGRDVGHISIRFGDGAYLSHVPDKMAKGLPMGVRRDVPGFRGTDLLIQRFPSVRYRTLADDESKFGKHHLSLVLPDTYDEQKMEEAARYRWLVTAPHEPPLHGPLPYYQLADSEKGKGDRSQCSTTTAQVIAAGVSLTAQHQARTLLEQFTPDSLWKALNSST